MKPENTFKIEGRTISDSSPAYFIADIAANHDGDLERAIDLIHLAAESGADAAKFQHFTAETIVSDQGFKALGDQLSHQSRWRESVFEVYRRASVSLDWTEKLSATCRTAGITFFTSPYSIELVEAIDPFVPAYKIGSGDLSWHDIIRHIASKGKPYFLATGASEMPEVADAVNLALSINKQFCLMQCNTNYTASLQNFHYVNLRVLRQYQATFPEVILGLSDHTPGHSTVLGAITLGARMIEKHFTDDVNREGPDHAFSMNPRAWREMVDRTRELEAALGDGVKRVEENERETVVLQRRCVRANRYIPAGSFITRDALEVLRPAPQNSVPPYMIEKVIGRRIARDLSVGEAVLWEDLT